MKSSTATIIASLRVLSRDIVCDDGVATAAIADAADRLEELEQAIRRLAEQDATLSVCDGAVTVEMDATLTRDEREAMELAADYADSQGEDRIASDIRGFLERTK